MSMRYCPECGSILHEMRIVVEIDFGLSEGRVTYKPVFYCMNEKCSRFGLVSIIYTEKRRKDEEEKPKTNWGEIKKNY